MKRQSAKVQQLKGKIASLINLVKLGVKKYIVKLLDLEAQLSVALQSQIKNIMIPLNETLDKIEAITLIKLGYKGEVVPLYEFRRKVVLHLNQLAQDVGATEGDYQDLFKWFEYRKTAIFWGKFKRQFQSIKDAADWIIDNAISDLESHAVEEAFHKAASAPSGTDKEDAYQLIDSLKFEGSDRQIKWAKDIALKSLDAVCLVLKKNKSIPASAKWWIDNRNDVTSALLGL